jgi:hypothetical protein
MTTKNGYKMLNSEIIISIIIVAIVIHSFLFGYFFGSLTHKNGVNNNNSLFSSKQKETQNNKPQIFIDDKKFVTEIKTDNLEKKYDSLGDTKTTQDNISESVNKLKNLKR